MCTDTYNHYKMAAMATASNPRQCRAKMHTSGADSRGLALEGKGLCPTFDRPNYSGIVQYGCAKVVWIIEEYLPLQAMPTGNLGAKAGAHSTRGKGDSPRPPKWTSPDVAVAVGMWVAVPVLAGWGGGMVEVSVALGWKGAAVPVCGMIHANSNKREAAGGMGGTKPCPWPAAMQQN